VESPCCYRAAEGTRTRRLSSATSVWRGGTGRGAGRSRRPRSPRGDRGSRRLCTVTERWSGSNPVAYIRRNSSPENPKPPEVRRWRWPSHRRAAGGMPGICRILGRTINSWPQRINSGSGFTRLRESRARLRRAARGPLRESHDELETDPVRFWWCHTRDRLTVAPLRSFTLSRSDCRRIGSLRRQYAVGLTLVIPPGRPGKTRCLLRENAWCTLRVVSGGNVNDRMKCLRWVLILLAIALLSACSHDRRSVEFCSYADGRLYRDPMVIDTKRHFVRGSDTAIEYELVESREAGGFLSPFPLVLPKLPPAEMPREWTLDGYKFSISPVNPADPDWALIQAAPPVLPGVTHPWRHRPGHQPLRSQGKTRTPGSRRTAALTFTSQAAPKSSWN
jgi:hypothetical protein